MNIKWSREIISELHRSGVREIVFCAGARNSPLISVLEQTSGVFLHSFFEERSAAFFALGVSRRLGQPVAIITTSGTAAAELLPAVIEAHHTGGPLICLTADRPRRLRGTGAPQAIDQTGLYTKFVEREFDIEAGEMFSLNGWSQRAPVHVNICFDEPLIDEPPQRLDLSEAVNLAAAMAPTAAMALASGGKRSDDLKIKEVYSDETESDAAQTLRSFLNGDGLLLVLVGTLDSASERAAVADFLLRLKAPVYLEGTSGLRECARLQAFSLRSGDRLLSWALKNLGPGVRVLRIGGIPTVRVWRDFEEPGCGAEVLSLSSLPFSGLSRGRIICGDLRSILATTLATTSATTLATEIEGARIGKKESEALLSKDRKVEGELVELFRSEPLAEPSMVHALSRLIPSGALTYVGNSLPIREWDLAADRSIERPVEANRGVNGIDGQLSTFLGLAREGFDNWAILGDLTALYDLTAPWALRSREGITVRFVVINNGGGKIFQRIFRSALFENRHTLDFAHWAAMWSLGYQRWVAVPDSFVTSCSSRVPSAVSPDADAAGGDGRSMGVPPRVPLVAGSPSAGALLTESFALGSRGDRQLSARNQSEVIEIIPDDEATRRFWDRYDKLF